MNTTQAPTPPNPENLSLSSIVQATNPTVLSEAAQTARHYGNIRFSMFTVFTTISGALLAFPFLSGGSAFVHASPNNFAALCLVGAITSIFFGLSEFRISELVIFYQERADNLGAIGLHPKHGYWKRIIMLVMLAPSIVTFLFWTMVYLDCLVLPVVTG